jgi:hypothetical protein
VQKVMQRLPVGSGHDAGEFDKRLVVLFGARAVQSGTGAARVVPRSDQRGRQTPRKTCQSPRWSVGWASAVCASAELLSHTHLSHSHPITLDQPATRRDSGGVSHIAQARLVRFWIIGEHREIMRSCTAELVRGCWRMLTMGTPVRLLTVCRGLCCRDELLLA